MKIRIISRLSILMETVEMLYKYVNNLSLDNIKRDFLLKYGEQLSAEDRAYYDTLFQSLDSIIKEGTQDLDRNDSRLQYYFKDLQPEGCREWVCMAKVILYSFYDGKAVSYTHLTLPTSRFLCSVNWRALTFPGTANGKFTRPWWSMRSS